MPTFEQGFKDAESAAATVVKTADAALKAAKALKKATVNGDLAAMRSEAFKLTTTATAVGQAAGNVEGAWPFSPEIARRR